MFESFKKKLKAIIEKPETTKMPSREGQESRSTEQERSDWCPWLETEIWDLSTEHAPERVTMCVADAPDSRDGRAYRSDGQYRILARDNSVPFYYSPGLQSKGGHCPAANECPKLSKMKAGFSKEQNNDHNV